MLKEVPLEVILEMQKKEKEQKEAQQQVQRAMMKQNGLSFDETESFLWWQFLFVFLFWLAHKPYDCKKEYTICIVNSQLTVMVLLS